MQNFEDYLLERVDEVTSATYALIEALTPHAVGPVSTTMVYETAELVAQSLGKLSCFPYYGNQGTRDDVPCYLLGECENTDCPFKEDTNDEVRVGS